MHSPFPSRISRLAASIASAGSSHLLITNPKDVAYLTGFLGGDSYLIVPAAPASRPVVISDFRYQEELEEVAHLADLHIRTSGSLADASIGVLSDLRAARTAIQAEHATVALRAALAAGLGAANLADTSGLVAALRLIKDDSEVALIRAAAKIQEDAINAVLPDLRPGLTELEIAARIEAEMKTRGSSEPGFVTIVAAAAKSSLPHYRPGSNTLAADSVVLIDWGAVYRGYHADMTRTFALGRWPPQIKEIYAIVLDAHRAAAAACAPRKTNLEIDAVARDHITRAGYGERFGHGLGHGLGLDGHENPRLNPLFAPSELRPGMVVTIEPGIYLPGVGGVRLEDDYLITDRGCENLCSLPISLDWASR